MRHKLLMLATVAVCAAVTLDTAGDVGAFTSPPTAVPGLVAHWSFDEGSGTVASDSSGNGNNGTLYGPMWVEGHSGSALLFDGTDDYVEVPDDDTLDLTTGATVMAWVKVNGETGDHQIIVAKWYGPPEWMSSYILELQPDGATPQFVTFTSDGRQDAVSDATLPFGQWVFLAGTSDGSVARIYVNGVPAGEVAQSGTINVGEQLVLLGAHHASWDRNWLNGTLDEVKIYNRALTAEEIQDEYHPPVAYWKFDEGSGTVASDSSGNGNDGTLHGPTWVAGHSGSTLDFDGSDDWVDVPDSDSLDLTTGATVMAWVKVDGSTGDHQELVSKWFACPGEWQGAWVLEMYPDSVTPQWVTIIGGEGNTLQSNVTVPNGTWFHLAATYDGSVKRIYLNGKETGTYSMSGTLATNSNPLQLGRHNLGTCESDDWNWLNGAMDEVKIYNRALTAEEIQAQMGTAPRPGVGGIAELPDAPKAPQTAATSSPGTASAWAAVAGLGVGAAILGASVWYAKKRRLR